MRALGGGVAEATGRRHTVKSRNRNTMNAAEGSGSPPANQGLSA